MMSLTRVVLLLTWGWAGMGLLPVTRAEEPPPMPLATQAPAGDPNPGASPSLDPDFLNLPAFDLDRVEQPGQSGGASKVRVGDSIILRIQGLNTLEGVKNPQQDLKLEVPAGTESLTDQGWELDPSGANPVPAGEYRVKATPLKSGHFTLPSLAIKNATSKSLARTNPYNIDVDSVIRADDPKPEQPADMRPPVSLRFPWWVLALGALLLALLVGGSIYGYRKWGRKPKAAPPKPAEPPRPEDEVALAAFAELERSGPLKRGDFKQHYFKVSEITKTYIGARYQFDASESTTREMISVLEERRVLGDQQIDKLESLFERLDLVKFTDHVPMPDEGLRLLGIARELVLTTRRAPEVIPALQQPTQVQAGGGPR